MWNDLGIDISGLPRQYEKLCRRVSEKLAELDVANVCVWGAGETGKLLLSVLISNKIVVDNLYDSSVSGEVHNICIEKPPERFESNTFVVVAIDPGTSGYDYVVNCLNSQHVNFLALGSNNEVMDNQEVSCQSPKQPYKHSLGSDHFKNYRDQTLGQYKNLHQGSTCVIIGNGPSLMKTDFGLLDGVVTIGLNKIFKLFERTDFRPTYMCSYIKDVVSQCLDEFISFTDVPLFVAHECLDILPPNYSHVHYFGPHKQHSFSTNPINEICCGYTVSYIAMQLAYYMGFKRVVLIGMDHDFAGYDGEGDQFMRIDKARPMHFDPEYFSSGQFWQTPNYKMMENSFRFAKNIFENDSREIIDATIDGKLTVYPKMTLVEALALG